MTDNEKLAKWQGKCYHVSDWGQTTCKYCGRTNDPRYFDFDTINPDYLNDDAAAMSLLDTLVERGYEVYLTWTGKNQYAWSCMIFKNGEETNSFKNSIRREAVVAAVLELIEKEVLDIGGT